MIELKNVFLKKYEIKKPDYDLLNRPYIGMEKASFEPARYSKKRFSSVWEQKEEFVKKLNEARLMFVGDITCFEKQIESARNNEDYDFNYAFDYVRPLFAQADLTVGNLETMIFPKAPYRTEKYVAEQNFHCNAPVEFLDAVRNAGIDVLTNANNHDLDTGVAGLGATIDYLDRFGFIHTGTFKRKKHKFELIRVNDINIAITAFATQHNNKMSNITEKGRKVLLSNYSPEVARDIASDARKCGADIVIACIHWGTENVSTTNKEQDRIANELVDFGYDCIIGSHPHVLQPFKLIKNGEKEVPLFYSMGNFISHNIDNAKARSIIAVIDIKRESGKCSLVASYIPIFTTKTYGSKEYIVLPLKSASREIKNYKRVKRIRKILGSEIKADKEAVYFERIEDYIENPEELPPLNIDTSGFKEFPIDCENRSFAFTVYSDHAVLKSFSSTANTSSYTAPTEVGDIKITEVADGVFAGNTEVKKINFSEAFKTIPENACKGCTALEGVQFSKATGEICSCAFSGCTSLSAVVIRKTVSRVSSKAFENCTSLRSVKIYNGVESIADDAFSGCPRDITFYCEKNSYGYKWAKQHGFRVVKMTMCD